MFKQILLIRFLVIIVSTIYFAAGSYAQDYYPLQAGNRWDYFGTHWDPYTGTTDTFYTSIEILSDSLFPNGKKYFVIDDYDLTHYGKYVRCDGSYVYYYDIYNEKEDTVYRLKANVGDFWEVQFGATAFVSVEEIDTVFIFGYSSIIINFKLDGLILFYVTLSDKFGPISYYSPGEPPGTNYTYKSVLGCVIDSIQYGNLVSVKDETQIPQKFILYQNYPNPFNPSTAISYSIPASSFTQLKIYDVLGNEVATLVNEEKPAGDYEVEFNAEELTSGVYFYRLSTGSFVSTKKMLLLK